MKEFRRINRSSERIRSIITSNRLRQFNTLEPSNVRVVATVIRKERRTSAILTTPDMLERVTRNKKLHYSVIAEKVRDCAIRPNLESRGSCDEGEKVVSAGRTEWVGEN